MARMRRPISFAIETKVSNSLACAGRITTPHGTIETPAFTAVATKATVKGLLPMQYKAFGTQVIIANTYHLYLSPGERIVADAGGLHTFMGWDGPLMTDSGGFQVFSLGVGFGKRLSKFLPPEVTPEPGLSLYDEDVATQHGKLAIIDEEGVTFTSHIDGTLHRFTPERSIEIQHALGADIIFAFDECTAPNADHAYQKEAMDRTHRWAKRSLAAHRQDIGANARQGIFGIVQGGRFSDLRIESARELADMDFDGYGIGGSFSKHDILGILDKVNRELPEEKPRHLLGIGEPEDIFIGVEAGVDTFDCVLPTRNGRTGTVYTRDGKLHVDGAERAREFIPIDAECGCFACATYTRAYIHHLFKTKETTALILASAHNLYFLTNLVKEIRESIVKGNFSEYRNSFMGRYKIKV